MALRTWKLCERPPVDWTSEMALRTWKLCERPPVDWTSEKALHTWKLCERPSVDWTSEMVLHTWKLRETACRLDLRKGTAHVETVRETACRLDLRNGSGGKNILLFGKLKVQRRNCPCVVEGTQSCTHSYLRYCITVSGQHRAQTNYSQAETPARIPTEKQLGGSSDASQSAHPGLP